MKKIKLCEATDEQIKNYVLDNPDNNLDKDIVGEDVIGEEYDYDVEREGDRIKVTIMDAMYYEFGPDETDEVYVPSNVTFDLPNDLKIPVR